MITLLTTITLSLALSHKSEGQPETKHDRSTANAPGQHALMQGGLLHSTSPQRPATTPHEPQYPTRSAAPLALGGSIAFATDRTTTFDIYVQDADGSNPADPLVTGPGDDYTPVWSPDGAQVVFASDRDGDADVYLRTASGEEQDLTQNSAEDWHPAWSPDGERIIFSSDRGGGYFQVYTMRSDGTDVQQVGVVPDNNAVHPRYSPDGSRIAFMRASVTTPLCEWNWDVWVMDADGGNQRRVTTRLGADVYPNWTPDGTEIVYASCRNFFDTDLYAVNPDTMAERQLNSWFLSDEWGAVYAPDAGHMAFNTDSDGNAEIYVVPAQGGTTAFNFTQNSADDLAASWGNQATPAIYSISGHAHDDGGDPIPGVTLSDDAGHTTTTGSDGSYSLSVLTGTYTLTPSKSGWTFFPLTRTVSVPPSAAGQDFTGTHEGPPASLPIVLVHGIQFMPGSDTRRCSDGIDPLAPGVTHTFGGMAQWFDDAGYDVWIANLDTGPLYTPPIEENAQCLQEQVASVREQTGQRVILVTHSMGGLVSRACLNLDGCRDDVAALYTLGSPHAGVNSAFLLKLLARFKAPIAEDLVCAWQPALCQITTDGMLWFNLFNPNRAPIAYHFIGGEKTPFPLGWLLWPLDGRNDGLVGSYSAVGWLYPLELNVVLGPEAGRYWTDETHSGGVGHPSYFEQSGGPGKTGSQAFRCITALLEGHAPEDCQVTRSALNGSQAQPTLSAATIDLAGHLASGQSVSHALQIDTSGHSVFYLSWLSGTLSFTLTQPNGQVVAPSYAALHPEVVTYASSLGSPETPPAAAYAFTATMPGIYTLTIGAGNVDSHYLVFVALETERTLSVETSAHHYQPGDTAIFSGTLQGPLGEIAGANVQVQLMRMDRVTDTLVFADLGDGTYRATYTVPDAPGYLQAAFTAVGDDGGTAFSRQVDKLLTIAPHDAQLAGAYADRSEDRDGDGFDDTLALDIGVTATQVGTYTLAADLVSADLVAAGQTVAHATHYAVLAGGAQTVTLHFDGWDMRRSRLNGPYTVTHVALTDLGVGSIPAQIADDVWTTAAYSWQNFGFESLYLPVVLKDH
jgi:TolB protein